MYIKIETGIIGNRIESLKAWEQPIQSSCIIGKPHETNVTPLRIIYDRYKQFQHI